jgi:[acyl-carrier-protein] S-malonyltransferase
MHTAMSVGLLFSGQGAQQIGMGLSLYESSDSVRALYEKANEILGWDLKSICFEGPEESLRSTKVCQPALYVHGYAIFTILKEKGLLNNLTSACGLSLGELTDMDCADVFDFETGLRLVAERGRLMQLACDTTKGGMASIIGGEPKDVLELCNEFDVEIANLNCPGQIVVSGENEKILNAVANSAGRGFKLVKPLNVAGAYHSRLMTSARDAFALYIKDFNFNTPTISVYTNVTGQKVDAPEAIKENLIKQVVSSVRFEECLTNAYNQNKVEQFYECGPGKVLAGLARRTDRAIKVRSLYDYEDLAEL